MPKQTLNHEQKYFITIRLARRRTPSQVAMAVHAEFGLVLARQVIEYYDPTKRAGRELPPKWRDLFYVTRVKYDMELEAKANRQE